MCVCACVCLITEARVCIVAVSVVAPSLTMFTLGSVFFLWEFAVTLLGALRFYRTLSEEDKEL